MGYMATLQIYIWLGGCCCLNGDRLSKKDRKDQYLHEVRQNSFLVTDENMGLCLCIYINYLIFHDDDVISLFQEFRFTCYKYSRFLPQKTTIANHLHSKNFKLNWTFVIDQCYPTFLKLGCVSMRLYSAHPQSLFKRFLQVNAMTCHAI